MKEELYKQIFAVLENNVSGVKMVAPNSIDVASLPQACVLIPEAGNQRDSFGDDPNYNRSGNVSIEVISDDIVDMLQAIDNIETALKNNWSDLSVQIPSIGTGSNSQISLGGKIVFVRTIPISFMKK